MSEGFNGKDRQQAYQTSPESEARISPQEAEGVKGLPKQDVNRGSRFEVLVEILAMETDKEHVMEADPCGQTDQEGLEEEDSCEEIIMETLEEVELDAGRVNIAVSHESLLLIYGLWRER